MSGQGDLIDTDVLPSPNNSNPPADEQPPFDLLAGELIIDKFLLKGGGVLFLTCYRVCGYCMLKPFSIPVSAIELVKTDFQLFVLEIISKYGPVLRLKFAADSDCNECAVKLNNLKDQPSVLDAMKEVPASNEETETLLKSGCMDVNFALRHHAAFYDTKQQRSAVSNSASKKQKSVGSVDEAEGDEDEFISSDQSTQQQQQPVTPVKHVCKPDSKLMGNYFNMEINRMGFDMNRWRISTANSEFKLCDTYPHRLIVPAWITDEELMAVTGRRYRRRIPAICYRHQKNGAVLLRSSQLQTGGARDALGGGFAFLSGAVGGGQGHYPIYQEDVHLLSEINKAASYNKPNADKSDDHTPRESDSNKFFCGSPPTVLTSDDTSFSNPPVSPNSPLVSLTATSSCPHNDSGDLSSTMVSSAFQQEPPLPPLNKILIVDCRTWYAAVGNMCKLGAYEKEYPNCEIVWMDLQNIHAINTSFKKMQELLSSAATRRDSQIAAQATFWSSLEGSGWLRNLSLLLRAALCVVTAIARECRLTLVHCSDGWDRTAQVVSLAQLMLDPYYRTFQGFQVLVQREWLDFGHKFADRCATNSGEASPIFLQWLDCVFQLTQQFPNAFEFNDLFLCKLAQHVYSNLFGTFQCNSLKERLQCQLDATTCSIWPFISPCNPSTSNPNNVGNITPQSGVAVTAIAPSVHAGGGSSSNRKMTNCGRFTKNPFYIPQQFQVLYPHFHDSRLKIWYNLYSSGSIDNSSQPLGVGSQPTLEDSIYLMEESEQTGINSCSFISNSTSSTNSLPRFHSCDNLLTCHTCPADSASGGTVCSASGLGSTGNLNGSCTIVPLVSQVAASGGGAGGVTNSPKSSNQNTNMALDLAAPDNFGCDNGQRIGLLTTGGKSLPSQHQLRNLEVDSESGIIGLGPIYRMTPSPIGRFVFPDNTGEFEQEMESKIKAKRSSMSRKFDADGLVKIRNPIERQARAMENENRENKREIERLRAQNKALEMQHRALEKQMKEKCNRGKENMALKDQTSLYNGVLGCHAAGVGADGRPMKSKDDMEGSGEKVNGGGNCSSGSSGWDCIDEKETQITRWVPDHASPCCTLCNNHFSVSNRKHHCRSCGYVFCATCSNYQHEVPKEQLFKKVRVCLSCYIRLTDSMGAQECSNENIEPCPEDCEIANELMAATSIANKNQTVGVGSPNGTSNNCSNVTSSSPSNENCVSSTATALSIAVVTSAAAASKTTPSSIVSGEACRPSAVASAAS